MRVRFNNLYLQNKIVYNDYIKSLKKTIKESSFINGKEILLFEENFKKLTRSKFCVSVANGTDALIISLKCLGIKYGDDNFACSSHGYLLQVIIAVGAKPVFVDTDDFYH